MAGCFKHGKERLYSKKKKDKEISDQLSNYQVVSQLPHNKLDKH
jgi:hypothetical protein